MSTVRQLRREGGIRYLPLLARLRRNNGRRIKLCNNTYAHLDSFNTIIVRLHGNPILILARDSLTGVECITFRSCGYRTVTTKSRLNMCLVPLGYCITQRDYDWYIQRRSSRNYTLQYEHGFEDGSRIYLSQHTRLCAPSGAVLWDDQDAAIASAEGSINSSGTPSQDNTPDNRIGGDLNSAPRVKTLYVVQPPSHKPGDPITIFNYVPEESK